MELFYNFVKKSSGRTIKKLMNNYCDTKKEEENFNENQEIKEKSLTRKFKLIFSIFPEMKILLLILFTQSTMHINNFALNEFHYRKLSCSLFIQQLLKKGRMRERKRDGVYVYRSVHAYYQRLDMY